MTEDTLFAAAMEKTDPADRAAFLDQACSGDAALRARLEARFQSLVGEGYTGATLPTRADGQGSACPGPLTESACTAIGPFKLLDQLGEGGMGTVYLAEQEQPVRRHVALKIIKAGMDSAQVIARFEQERQALALMDHPNIAKVLDAGTTDRGRPFFVMELVRGINIIKFCDHEHLVTEQRLRLFIPVCEAVQHAHQKGIIHRDLKPSNVIVGLYDGKPVPKVIDFGVAKATRQRLTPQTLFTEIGQVVGTVEYMSPEQAEVNNLDIDTRSDIYSLGVLLYELLTGSTPLSRKRLREVPFTEMLRIIREDEPQRPSTRLSQSGEALPSIAAQRKTEPRKLTKVLAGDLDWIVMKALAKERERRYESANALALDIKRYLADEPVLAGPPSVGYRLRKFARRHRGQVAAATLVVAALVAGIIGTTLAMLWAWRAEADTRTALFDLGEQQQKTQSALDAEINARKRTREALNAMTDDVIEKLLAQQPQLGEDEKAFLRKVLNFYEEFAKEQGETAEGRAVAAEGQLRVAKVQAFLGQRSEAEDSYRKAIKLFEKLAAEFPANPVYRRNLAVSYNNIGVVLVDLGKPGDAEVVYRRALELREQLATDFPVSAVYRQDVATTYNNLGVVLRELKNRPGAKAAYDRALKLRDQLATEYPKIPVYRQELAGSHFNLGILLRDLKQPVEAEAAYRRALELYGQLTADFPAVAAYRRGLALSHNSLGILFYGQGEREPAKAQFLRALELREQLAAQFPAVPQYQIDVAGSYVNLGQLVIASGQAKESLDWFAKAVTLLEVMLKRDTRVSVVREFLRNAYAGRAEALVKMKCHGDAAVAWGRAIELDDGAMRSKFGLARAVALVRSGDHRAASAAADGLAQGPKLDGRTLYNLACVYALSRPPPRTTHCFTSPTPARPWPCSLGPKPPVGSRTRRKLSN
jgi:serine/threonine protein kinase/tetratricopeptide (TPR) repeat protein